MLIWLMKTFGPLFEQVQVVTTGDSTIGAGAFSNLDGISAVVINTGNNVSIQNSTVVNIVIED